MINSKICTTLLSQRFTLLNENSLTESKYTLDISCDGKDNTKEQCNFIPLVLPLKTECLGKK